MILVAFGSNLSGRFGSPLEVCQTALRQFSGHGLRLEQGSFFYQTAPVPVSDQPWYVNGVVALRTHRDADGVLATLREIETGMGRIRCEQNRNAARVLDLDLLAYNDQVCDLPHLTLPHPRMQERGFVLAPLCDIAPDWVHPVRGKTAAVLYAELGNIEGLKRLDIRVDLR